MIVEKFAPTITYDIYMAGDIMVARDVCRDFCDGVGFCVHLMPAEYIYTHGNEQGFKVGIINYPRFPATKEALLARAASLADRLMHACQQGSYSIVGPDETYWHSRRPADNENSDSI